MIHTIKLPLQFKLCPPMSSSLDSIIQQPFFFPIPSTPPTHFYMLFINRWYFRKKRWMYVCMIMVGLWHHCCCCRVFVIWPLKKPFSLQVNSSVVWETICWVFFCLFLINNYWNYFINEIKWGPLSTKVVRLHSTGYLFTTHNQCCVPSNPEVDRKISYI